MAFDKKGFLAKIAKDSPAEGEGKAGKSKKRDINPIEVLRLALHEPDSFEAAFREAVRYCDKED